MNFLIRKYHPQDFERICEVFSLAKKVEMSYSGVGIEIISLEKDEMGIGLGALTFQGYDYGYKIAEGTYNMQITGNSSATISVQGINSSWGVQAKIGKASYNPSNVAVQTFNVSKTYSGSWKSGNSVGVIPLDDVNLPYDFGTVTFSSNEILQCESGSNAAGNGLVQNTPSWTITLYEIIS